MTRSINSPAHITTAPAPVGQNLEVAWVELFDGRVQGVVAATPLTERLHAVTIEAHTGHWSCAGRGCRAEGPRPCGHVAALVQGAVEDFGAERVACFLGRPDLREEPWRIVDALGGIRLDDHSDLVFGRFLDYLRYVQLPSGTNPGDLTWFPTG